MKKQSSMCKSLRALYFQADHLDARLEKVRARSERNSPTSKIFHSLTAARGETIGVRNRIKNAMDVLYCKSPRR